MKRRTEKIKPRKAAKIDGFQRFFERKVNMKIGGTLERGVENAMFTAMEKSSKKLWRWMGIRLRN